MKTLVVGIDPHEDPSPLLDQVRQLAHAFESRVLLVHIAEPDPTFMPFDGDLPELRQQRAEVERDDHRAVQRVAESLRAGGLDVTALQFRAPTAEGLAQKARDVGADLIIVGTHRRGPLLRALLGSVSQRVVQLSPCPVLIVPTDSR